jgi:hypothetical protein
MKLIQGKLLPCKGQQQRTTSFPIHSSFEVEPMISGVNGVCSDELRDRRP